MRRHARFLHMVFVLLVVISSAGCNLIPSAFDVDLDVETTSELGPDTLERIDAVNDTLATGIEIGPETRGVISELNQTIANGVKAGFDEDTLARVDELLRVVEDGLEIGLDDETLDTIDGMVETIDAMPGQWEDAASDIIRTLEGSAGTAAGRMADEIEGVMKEARLNLQQLTASAGTEFRCNVDFLGSKAGATVQEFIGKSIIGRIKSIISGEDSAETIPTPWVCQVIPNQIELAALGGRIVALDGIVMITGYNYVDGNAPAAHIVDEAGTPVPGITLYPYRTSPYEIQVNLQDIDFSTAPARSRIVLQWPNVPETSGIALLMPGFSAPVAKFQVDPPSGGAPLTVQFTDQSSGDPTQWQWTFGDGSTSNERNPVHTFVEGRDYTVQLTASNAVGSSTVSESLVVSDQLVADFRFSPRQGNAPLVVQFEDTSTGSPSAWEWDFGDGGTSSEQNPEHVYIDPQPEGYSVTLRISGAQGSDSKTSPDLVIPKEKLDAAFEVSKTRGQTPLTIDFADYSKGTGIASWLWEFGDGTMSNQQNPSHTYTEANTYDVSLTVTNTAGENNKEVKRGLINAFTFKVGIIVIPPLRLFQTTKAYFSTFTLGQNQKTKDTGISTEKYICGITGMLARNGDIEESGAGDILKAVLIKQFSASAGKETWWINADFRTHNNHEDWEIRTLCLDAASQGSVYLYKDDYRGIAGGEPLTTDISTEDYIFCGVVGQEALYGDIQEHDVRPVIWQAYADGSGSKWKIMADFATHNHNETWHINLLCIKRNAFPAAEKPAFITEPYYIAATGSAGFATDIRESEYACGVTGVSAERGDIEEDGTRSVILAAYTAPAGGIWKIYADFASHNKNEDWRVDILCINKEYATIGVPPP